MSLNPGLHKYKKTIKTKLTDVFIDGENFVEDFARENGRVIYFLCLPLERGIALKSYFNSFKLNFVKAVDFETKKDSNTFIPKEYGLDLSYDISLDIPAANMEEARNNFAKIGELQKLIAPMTHDSSRNIPYGTSSKFDSHVPYFSVWFKNLISSGIQYGEYPSPENVTVKDMFNYGFICLIEEVKYEPDMEAGFFEHDTLLLPKNIKLNLNLKYAIEIENISASLINSGFLRPQIPFLSFLKNGHFSKQDRGGFPFGVGVFGGKTAKGKDIIEQANASLMKQEFTMQSMNTIDTSMENGYDPTTIFISMHIDKNRKTFTAEDAESAKNTRIRYVQFKAFITSFDRNVKMGYTENIDKGRTIGQSIANTSVDSTLEELSYNVSFDIPSESLEQAKKNCGKIQYLIRMFAKSGDYDTNEVTEEGQELANKLAKRDLKVYIPNFIESKNSWGKFGSFSTMYNSAVDLVLSSALGGGYHTQGTISDQDHLFPNRRPYTSLKRK